MSGLLTLPPLLVPLNLLTGKAPFGLGPVCIARVFGWTRQFYPEPISFSAGLIVEGPGRVLLDLVKTKILDFKGLERNPSLKFYALGLVAW